MRKILILAVILVVPAVALAWTMGLQGMKWPSDAGMKDLYFGHEAVQDMGRVDVEHLCEDVSNAWTDQLYAGPVFNLIEQGDGFQYDGRDPDGYSTLCWRVDDGTCAVGHAYQHWDLARKAPWSIAEIDLQLLEGGTACGGYYCWFDCSTPGDFCADEDLSFDARNVLTHEWGHAAAGFDHFSPKNHDLSCMYHIVDGCCRTFPMGSVDIELANWAYGFGDRDEPVNDYLDTATDLGSLLDDGQVGNNFADKLIGYVDVDIFEFYCTLGSDHQLDGLVNPNENTESRFGAQVFFEETSQGTFTSSAPGGEVYFQLPARVGNWQVRVFTTNYYAAPYPYLFLAQAFRAVCTADTPNDGPLSFQFNTMTKLAWGTALNSGGRLQLFDVGSRILWERGLPSGESWSERIEQDLASGVYFVRLVDGGRHAVKQFVVVK
jgi:hypothetical protein